MLSISSASRGPTLTIPTVGSPGRLARSQPLDDGVSTSNSGCSSSRTESTSRPSHQKYPASVRRSVGSNRTVKSRSPARKRASGMASSVSDAKVAPPTLHAVRGLTISHPR